MYTARIKLPADFSETDIAKLAGALGDISSAHSALREDRNEKGRWILEWITDKKPDQKELLARLSLVAEIQNLESVAVNNNDWDIEKLPDINWLEHSYQQFPAFAVGPFYIYGAHHQDNVPPGKIGLQIEAATAFGSGEHGTTAGCLQAMVALKDQGVCPWNVLDMGCGSGILAIAAYKLWKTPITAIDNDPEAIAVTTRHLDANGITPSPTDVLCAVNDGFEGDFLTQRGAFDLILANILPGPLKEMADDLKAVSDENGYIILSGILNEQADEVLKTYEALGLTLKETIEIDGWATLVLHNPG